ncbi:AraC family transcriptional regulator [Streptomyces sp. A7024]|uniref:AraC family transcriptional regulator n=1 Tax=Streptomyces coryli TaxID=1128680 RepID=A0A6G4UBZ2_9ACTN|nr:AraC family transcriptional regulator [Streptomyces coryli]NGN69532.1 AraC family transcriptional regulator [Streptomyces coryli]
MSGADWATYWRDPVRPVEAMRAHYVEHVFHKHSHDAYSFGVTEEGAQRFACRGGQHTSAAGLVMTFNPDDPHDGESAAELGFTYRIVHIGPDVVRELLAEQGAGGELPLFPDPVHHDPVLRRAVVGLHEALAGGAGALVREERLMAAVTAMVRRRAKGARPAAVVSAGRVQARRAAEVLRVSVAEDLTAEDLTRAAGAGSRFALYRAFKAEYGMAPSDYQRLLRLRAARRAIVAGSSAADAAAVSGFADQAHFHRWFVRSYGVTPGAYAKAAAAA